MSRFCPVAIAMLNVTLSNRFEVLLDALLVRLKEVPDSPFDPEQIIVPSTAIRRRVTLAAANKSGIFANVEFSYLAQWLWRQIGRIVPVQKDSPFTPAVLSWRVYRILEDDGFTREHPRLASYLAHADEVMRKELSCRIAALFDEYVAYRPDWLAAWAAGQPGIIEAADVFESSASANADRIWQAALWRRILLETGVTRKHPAIQFFEALNDMGTEAASLDWPKRVHVFCLPTMPLQYTEMLSKLGQWIDLQLYVLNPCREYWFEIVDPRRLSYLAARGKAGYHESGNKLLASWGRQCQAHLDLLIGEALHVDTEDSRFVANADERNKKMTLLSQVQDAVLDLRDLSPEEIVLKDSDRSIEVHVCHSLTRELEVLHDQLLSMFAGEQPPNPQDILVVVPDLEQAAPLVDAVFGRHTEQSGSVPAIPYVITGRGSSKVNPAARALLDLLKLMISRFDALSVFDLLRQPMVARRFFVEDDLDTIHEWLEQSGIRWGLDGSHREQLGLPRSSHHSFEDGMHRLIMGYALPPSSSAPFNGRLPAGFAEGKNAQTLGCLWHFVRQLDLLRNRLCKAMPAADWLQALHEAINTFMQPGDDQIDDMEEAQERIRILHRNVSQGCGDHSISLEVMLAALVSTFDDPARGGVPTGSVTFSSMSSLRNLPYRVICAIGMNDGSFPTDSRPAEFDLMRLVTRRGDRQRRFDERNLFLDLLLAARERFYLSYTGNSVRDNSAMPPSVLISELLDYLSPVRERLLVQHPLQAFSAGYFAEERDARLVSYRLDHFNALQHALSSRKPAVSQLAMSMAADVSEDDDDIADEAENALPFFVRPLPDPGDEFRSVSVAQLISFFRNPCRYLLRQRLGISFPEAEKELSAHEPFTTGRRERQLLAERLLPLYLAGKNPDEINSCAKAGIECPSGSMGDAFLRQELKAVSSFAEALRIDHAAGIMAPSAHACEFELDGEIWRLHGTFSDLRTNGLVRYRYDATSATDYLAGWIEHLFLNLAGPDGVVKQTVWHSSDGSFRLLPCEQAKEQLQMLLRMYRDGLCRPLHFFPRSAWKYIMAKNLDAAVKAWRQDEFTGFGEGTDPSYRLALRGVSNPIDTEFVRIAETVLGPLLQHLEDSRLA